jgi:photosynthetic reaction center H subunit
MTFPGLTQDFDVGLLVIDTWVLFFIGLIFYLRREDQREGYPLVSERTGRPVHGVFISSPPKKTYLLEDGSTLTLPREPNERTGGLAQRTGPVEGTPFDPTGNPLRDAVGPASYAGRQDHPDVTWEGEPRILPLRVAKGWSLVEDDIDPRGWDVVATDGKTAGTVKEAWIDQVEPQVYYWEVALTSGRTVLLPARLAVLDEDTNKVRVQSITAAQFADVPGIKNPNEITLLEEDKISGYFAGGKLFALPERREPLI